MTALSFVQAAALWRHEAAPRTQAFFEALSAQLHPVLPFASGWLLENGAFATTWSIVLTYWIALAVASAAVLALVLSLLHRPEPAGAGLPRLLLQWSYGFAGVCALAFPVFTQDLWLSAAWGRMIAAGVNPFHTLFTPESLAGLPLDHFPMPMSYGPLWGLVSGGDHADRRRQRAAHLPCSSRRCSRRPGSARCISSTGSPRACRTTSAASPSPCSDGRRRACRSRLPRATTTSPWWRWPCSGCSSSCAAARRRRSRWPHRSCAST